MPGPRRGASITVKDVTGVAFAGDAKVVYTVSPVYGKPGVFLFDCASRRLVTLVRPRFFNHAYPDGTDYFELSKASGNDIYFYYAPDVDSADFAALRTEAHLYRVDLQGSDMRRIE